MARHTPALKEGHAPVRDRLITTLFLAALVHGLIIVGVTFNAVAKGTSGAPGIEVLLVSDELPEAERNDYATYLAQRTQLGAGNTREQVAAHHAPRPQRCGRTRAPRTGNDARRQRGRRRRQ